MEEIKRSVMTCLTKYADFNGRAARPEFWWFMLAQFLGSIILGMVSQTLSGVFSLVMLVPSLAVGSRRLHDLGKTGWLQLLAFIPIVGWLLLIYWDAQPGEPAANQYGPPPETPMLAPVVAPGQQ